MGGYIKHGSYVESMGSPRVFAHDIDTLRGFSGIIDTVPGIRKYDRALAIARAEDVVFLKSTPDESYLQWLDEVGLGTKNLIVLPGRADMTLPERIMNNGSRKHLDTMLNGQRREAVFSPYYGGRFERSASRYLGVSMHLNTEVTEEMDNKVNFKLICRGMNIPVVKDSLIDTNMTLSEMCHIIDNLLDETGKIILRGEYGASASTIHVLNKMDDVYYEKLLRTNLPGTRFLVEPFYQTLSSPSSVWYIGQTGEIVHLRTSNQLLENGISHIGNEFPVSFDEEFVNKVSFQFAQYMRSRGFTGPFGIDYIETEQGILATECNPRMTGAIYPWELVYILERKGPVGAARSENIHLPKKYRTFESLKRVWADFLFDGETSEDVIIPFNVGPIKTGKITVLGTSRSVVEVRVLLDSIKTRLKD